jgi:hypothetical protein
MLAKAPESNALVSVPENGASENGASENRTPGAPLLLFAKQAISGSALLHKRSQPSVTSVIAEAATIFVP